MRGFYLASDYIEVDDFPDFCFMILADMNQLICLYLQKT